jgi:hypothetical protein
MARVDMSRVRPDSTWVDRWGGRCRQLKLAEGAAASFADVQRGVRRSEPPRAGCRRRLANLSSLAAVQPLTTAPATAPSAEAEQVIEGARAPP